MHMRFVMFLSALLLLLTCSLSLQSSKMSVRSSPHQIDGQKFIVFTNDGTLYKLDVTGQIVEWYTNLPLKLLSIDFEEAIQDQIEAKIPNIIIPTLDGDFLYIEKKIVSQTEQEVHKQILIEREDVEVLLDMCFVQQNTMNQYQYFVYENFEYFVLNFKEGSIEKIEHFFEEGKVLNKQIHSIIFVDQKLLKQTNKKMQVRWSVISSKINLMSISQFGKNTHKLTKQLLVNHKKYNFERSASKVVNIKDQFENIIFEIQTNSAILSIFGFNQKQFREIKVINSKYSMLALQDRSFQTTLNNQSFQIQLLENKKAGKVDFENFPHSQNFAKNQYNFDQQITNLQICITSQKVLKQLNMGKNKQFISSFTKQQLPTIPYSNDKPLQKVIVAKEQPYLIYSIFLTFIILGFGFYRIKVNKLWQQMSQIENIHDEKWKNLASKVGQFQEIGKAMKRMYDVNWDNIVQQNPRYFMFEGRFLNKNCYVYVMPLAGMDIIGIQHKLNDFFGSSHKIITKLYYYTRNDDSLLIFTQKNQHYKTLKHMNTQDFKVVANDQQKYRQNIKLFIQAIKYLQDLKIQTTAFLQESWLFDPNSLSIKINIIPSFLQKQDEQLSNQLSKIGVCRIRLNMVECIHRFVHNGNAFDLDKFQKQKNTEEQENFFLKDFYDYLLTDQPSYIQGSARKLSAQVLKKSINTQQKQDNNQQHNQEDSSQTKQETIKVQQNLENKQVKQKRISRRDITSHPFLWDSKYRILFLTEFSNYAETYIDESKNFKMESHCKKMHIVSYPWSRQYPSILVREINNYRKYDFNSVRDLIRLIRNKLNHYHEMPRQIKNLVGKTPEQFLEYSLNKFPKLLPFMYIYASKKRWKLNVKL